MEFQYLRAQLRNVERMSQPEPMPRPLQPDDERK